MSRIFDKPAKTIDGLITLAQSRGLIVDDYDTAHEAIKHIGYYRLSGYMLPFQEKGNGGTSHTFLERASFKDILDTYTFDRKLRLLVMDAVERIEISIRAIVSDVMSLHGGSHWFLNPDNFKDTESYRQFIAAVREAVSRSRCGNSYLHIDHYYEEYGIPDLPPSWMIFEVLTFGTISTAYGTLPLPRRKEIARHFNLHYRIMASWMHVITHLRNLCAHHARLYNRCFRILPRRMNAYRDHLERNDAFYAQAVVIKVLLDVAEARSTWGDGLKNLLNEYPNIDPVGMSFPKGWENMNLWGR